MSLPNLARDEVKQNTSDFLNLSFCDTHKTLKQMYKPTTKAIVKKSVTIN